MELSSPLGASINDADACHMYYSSVLDTAMIVRQLDGGGWSARYFHGYR